VSNEKFKLVGFALFVGLLLRIYHISQIDLISGFQPKVLLQDILSISSKEMIEKETMILI
jgi:hypothetical protein